MQKKGQANWVGSIGFYKDIIIGIQLGPLRVWLEGLVLKCLLSCEVD